MPNVERMVQLDDVVVTYRLAERPARAPAYAAESAALVALAQQLATDPDAVLSRLMELAVDLCHGGTAGVSLLERTDDGSEVFRWVALGGALASHVGGATPREHSPCGTCLDRGTPQLYDRPGRYFTYFEEAGVTIVEGLVVPMSWRGVAVGTIWCVSHDDHVRFDREDVRVLSVIAEYTAAALETRRMVHELRAQSEYQQQILAIVSHDLRDPVSAIAMAASRLRDEATDARSTRTLDRLTRSCDRVTRMVHDLLDFASIRAGQPLTLATEPVDLAALVRELVDEERLVFPGRTIELHVSGDTAAACDPGRIAQAVSNLLHNALMYSPDDTTVTIDVSGDVAGVVVRVHNRGAAMPERVRTSLFEPFRRGGPTPLDRHRSIGLGLFIVHQVAAAHDGKVVCEYSDDRGTCFTLALPRLLASRLLRPCAADERTPASDDAVARAQLDRALR